MPSLCLYFHAHQSIRLRGFSLLDISKGAGYEDEPANLAEFNTLLDSRCLPLNRRLLALLLEHRGALRAGISLSGYFLDMLEKHRPAEVASYRELARTGMVEFLGENYFRSFSFLYEEEEFISQVKLHRKKMKSLFGVTPVTFRNTEDFYSNKLSQSIEQLGFKTLLNEAAGSHGIESGLYRPAGSRRLQLVQGGREEQPLGFAVQGTCLQIHSIDCGALDHARIANVFRFINAALAMKSRFILPGEISDPEAPALDRPTLSPGQSLWNANYMQRDALHALYALSGKVRRRSKSSLLAAWRRLQLSDHFYNMRTGRHGEESTPYSSPYEAYIMYMNILADLSKSVARR